VISPMKFAHLQKFGGYIYFLATAEAPKVTTMVHPLISVVPTKVEKQSLST
jgi:hypothetical protein